MAEPMDPFIKAYRAGETLPKTFSRSAIIEMLNAINIGLEKGMPEIGAKNYGDKVLLEGREDAGANGFNYNNKRAINLASAVNSEMNNPGGATGATYVAAVLDKMEVAKRLGIPFELAWNGTGRTVGGAADGQRHTARAARMEGAINDPRNSEFKDLIDRGIKGELTPTEQASQVSYDTLRANAAGIRKQDLIELGTSNSYSKEAMDGVQKTIDSIIKDKKLSYPREVAVRKDIGYPAKVLNILPSLWRSAAGLTEGSTPELNNMSPDTIDVLNTIIGNN